MATNPSSTTTGSPAASDRATALLTSALKQSSDYVLTAARQTSKLSIEGLSAWNEALARFAPAARTSPFAPSGAALQEWLTVGYDAIEGLITVQREFATELVAKLTPAA